VKRCQGTNKAGERCGAPAGASGFCIAHDPDRKAEHRAGVEKGGRVARRGHDLTALPTEMPPATFARWLRGRLVDVWNRLEAGEIEPGVAHAFAGLSNAMKGLLEVQVSLDELTALAAEVADLRERLTERAA